MQLHGTFVLSIPSKLQNSKHEPFQGDLKDSSFILQCCRGEGWGYFTKGGRRKS